MTDVERLLAEELADLGEQAPHDAQLAGTVRRRARRQGAAAASALAVVLLVGAAAVAAGRFRTDAPTVAGTPPASTAQGCGPLETGPLPDWARTGFSSADPGVPFARSRNGGMLAIVFGDPLSAPPRPDRSNKILWVLGPAASAAPTPFGPDTFWADARLEGSDLRVRRDIGAAPGPSIVDLPAAGCWQLALHYGSYSDEISLRYGG
jgi:hypothetical protein